MPEKAITDDKEILQRLYENDQEALTALYKAHWDGMYVSAYNLVKDKAVCEDIVQEVFIKIWNKRNHLDIKVSLKSYLYTSTIYKVYDYFRKNKNKIEVELLENFDKRLQFENPETDLIHKEFIAHVQGIINTLPNKCKEVFLLSREEQLSHKEIGEKLGISHKTVEGHVSKALKILRDALGHTFSIELVLFICKHFMDN